MKGIDLSRVEAGEVPQQKISGRFLPYEEIIAAMRVDIGNDFV